MEVNTILCCDLKTKLQNDVILKPGKEYHGILRRDEEIDEFLCDEHYTFIETVARKAEKRNPHVFEGKYITGTQLDDGSLRLNFKKLKMGGDFNLERYALGVYNEICMALGGMVEK